MENLKQKTSAINCAFATLSLAVNSEHTGSDPNIKALMYAYVKLSQSNLEALAFEALKACPNRALVLEHLLEFVDDDDKDWNLQDIFFKRLFELDQDDKVVNWARSQTRILNSGWTQVAHHLVWKTNDPEDWDNIIHVLSREQHGRQEGFDVLRYTILNANLTAKDREWLIKKIKAVDTAESRQLVDILASKDFAKVA